MRLHKLLRSSLMGLLAMLTVGASPTLAQSVLSAMPPQGSADQTGRLLIGRGEDYAPSTVDAEVLFTDLEGSMKKRRDFAWGVIERMLKPVTITLLDGVSTVDVPLWQTWYEGRRSGASGNQELNSLVQLYFSKLKPVLDANPAADIEPVIKETMAAFSEKNLGATLNDADLSQTLHQFDGTAAAGSFLGQGTTAFSPSFVEHVLREARGIDECSPDVATADKEPPGADQFSWCMDEFPRSAVMIKTVWRKLSLGASDNDTGATALTKMMKVGTWPGVGNSEEQPPLAHPDRSKIYTNITRDGTEWALNSIHFVTKDVREWVWVSLWWDPEPNTDFGADRPASIASFNNGVWSNYKMCVNSSFAEKDPAPWTPYTGTQASLGDSIKAVYDAIADQLANGASSRPAEFTAFFGPMAQPLHLADGLGPWAAPHNEQTSWCSNPNVEMHPGNGRTSCMGCHQIAFTENERRGGQASFADALVGDMPQFARSQARKNFTAEFSWSFEIEFRPAIATAKRNVHFEWPPS